ncbi:MAG: fatty acid oxidation complex subunit alpha FadB [Gammaproteobacteria bacterium]|nr:MAG: fatty acid oxidation complex subunit alpha FadB [Gammaproteobacteria bacterium]
MIFSGNAIKVDYIQDSIANLVFDLEGESINKLSKTVVEQLGDAVSVIEDNENISALIISSNKDVFIVGADVTEFLGFFKLTEKEFVQWIEATQALFNRIEDLPIPTVTAINGYALGGGCELALTTDYRVMAYSARIGLPEVKLGIFPGWGGSVRLPRLIGADNALDWICTGDQKKAQEAFKCHAVDSIVDVDQLQSAAMHIVQQCLDGKLDYQKRKQEKRQPLQLSQLESIMAFESAKAVVAAKAGRHFPAPLAAIETVQHHATMLRDEAMQVEAHGFVKMAKTKVARNLVGLFLNDQRIKKVSRGYSKQAHAVKQAAVLGAGIMGGGIAYQSACKDIPIVMKDIKQEALELGKSEAGGLLLKQVKRGKIKPEEVTDTLAKIDTTLSYGDFANVDLVVEAVIENKNIKSSVLVEVEQQVKSDCILTSNTSTISITELALSLQRPEQFCGMHFFNPVYRMPLVEVIRGEKSSEAAIATTVAYAEAMGKTPIVVNDCAGFLVNRVLFPYFAGFDALVRDGIDIQRIDKIMENFGWPMGPAYLLDVVGIDTAHHASEVMAEAYPDRMSKEFKSATDALYETERYGQKNNVGFYKYELDKRGKQKKIADENAVRIIETVRVNSLDVSDEEIVDRMMIPMCMETVRCVEEGVVDHPLDADMGLILGIAFPTFRGGALRYIEEMGVQEFCERAGKYSHISPIYAPTKGLISMAKKKETFYPKV